MHGVYVYVCLVYRCVCICVQWTDLYVIVYVCIVDRYVCMVHRCVCICVYSGQVCMYICVE